MDNYINDNYTDDESYDTWDETDDESEYENEDILYEPEELTRTKYNIVHCVKLKCLKNYYLTLTRFKYLNIDIINYYSNMYPFINQSALRLEIAECIYLPSKRCVSIIKTFWLKIIQRKWKNICKERKLCLVRRANLNALRHREIYGKWPSNCTSYPLLKGMLSNLS